MVLVVVAGAIFSHGVSADGPAAGVGQWLVASLVWGIGLSLGGTTGYAINPARDLGPRLVHALLPIPGKGGSNWSYAAIPIAGPLTGGALAGLLLHAAHLYNGTQLTIMTLVNRAGSRLHSSKIAGASSIGTMLRHCILHWESPRLQHPNHLAKIFRQCIARPQNVQLLLHKEPCLVSHLLLRLPDVHHSSRECDLFHRGTKHLPAVQSPRSQHPVRARKSTPAAGHADHLVFVLITCAAPALRAVSSLASSRSIRHYRRSAKSRAGNRTQTHTAASEHRHDVACGHAPASHGMKSHRQRLNQAQLLQTQVRSVQLRRRNSDQFRQSSIALHAERLVELAGIGTIAQARGAAPAARVGRKRHRRPRSPLRVWNRRPQPSPQSRARESAESSPADSSRDTNSGRFRTGQPCAP